MSGALSETATRQPVRRPPDPLSASEAALAVRLHAAGHSLHTEACRLGVERKRIAAHLPALVWPEVSQFGLRARRAVAAADARLRDAATDKRAAAAVRFLRRRGWMVARPDGAALWMVGHLRLDRAALLAMAARWGWDEMPARARENGE